MKVTPKTWCNVRPLPSTERPPIGRLNAGDVATGIAYTPTHNGFRWIEVRIGTLKGFVREDVVNVEIQEVKIPEVNLAAKGRLTETNSRAFPLHTKLSFNRTTGDIFKIIDFLDVERSIRYRPTNSQTFCNIYAYDYAFQCNAYLPRVWWTQDSLNRIARGESVPSVYGRTVVEMNANALYDWFGTHSASFGWKETDRQGAQRAANEGKCVIAVGANINRSRSGHITCVVPESATIKANIVNGVMMSPVQSQAGKTNRKYFACMEWQRGHSTIKFYCHD
jgi:hypothetical protein